MGVEPTASLILSAGGLPVAYRAISINVPGGIRTGLADRSLGRSATGTSFSLDGWIRTSVLPLPTRADEAGLSYTQ